MEQLNPSLQNEDEIAAIKDTILLPLMLEMIDKERKGLGKGNSLAQVSQLTAIQIISEVISADLIEAKKLLFGHKCIVYPDKDNKLKCTYRYRGYTGDMTLLRDVAKAEIAVRFGKYIKDIGVKLDGG